jgi:hypothetical protein
MKIAVLAGLTALALASRADAAQPLTLSGTGPYYTLDVNLQAREVSASSSLADLRVRNAAGETMAFAWADVAPPRPAPQRVPARLYKVPLPPAITASAADGPLRQSWIVDTRDADDDLLRLDLALENHTQGGAAMTSVHWRTQDSGAPDLRSPPVRLGEVE